MEGPRGARMATPWAGWTDPTPLISNNPCQKYIGEKNSRVLGVFSFSDLSQQPVIPMISIHIFARGEKPRTRTTGANTNKES